MWSASIGGHTSEMISLVRGLDAEHYTPLVFVYAESDAKSPLHLQESHVCVFPFCDVAGVSLFNAHHPTQS